MERRDLIIGFMLLTSVGVIASGIIAFAMSGLGTQDDYFLWQQIVNFFIMLYFVGMLPYLLNEREAKKPENKF